MDTRYIALLLCPALALAAPAAHAQRHSERSSPPTAQYVPPAPIVPISTGLGAIQFAQVNFGVPAPQSLTRQLRFDDEHIRSAALSALGVPPQYLQRGHIPMPRTVDLELAPIGGTDELDALLTVELEQHLVTAVLIPVDGNWRRIATLTYAISFDDESITPDDWVRISRSLIQKDRYRAVFHASTSSPNGNFTENEAHLRIINGKAAVTMSFESTARECSAPVTVVPGKTLSRAAASRGGCDITQRWFQPDLTDPTKHFDLITATGHISPKDAEDPLSDSRIMLQSHLRNFSCQPFTYSDTTEHYEPTAANAPCKSK